MSVFSFSCYFSLSQVASKSPPSEPKAMSSVRLGTPESQVTTKNNTPHVSDLAPQFKNLSDIPENLFSSEWSCKNISKASFFLNRLNLENLVLGCTWTLFRSSIYYKMHSVFEPFSEPLYMLPQHHCFHFLLNIIFRRDPKINPGTIQ